MKQCWAAALLLAPLPAFAQEKPLRWGTDPTGGAPYVYQDASGKFIGFEVELAEYLAKQLGRTPVMVKADWDKLPQLLDKPVESSDTIDVVLNGYELKESLQKDHAATIPYYAYRLVLIAHRDNAAFASWKDLTPPAGPKRTVGVLGGSAAHEYALDRFGDRIDLKSNQDVVTVIGLVRDNRLDATIQDNPAATYFLKEMPELKAVGEPRPPGFYAMYVRKSEPQLRDALNRAIAAGLKDGTLERIYRKYNLWNADQEWLCFQQTGEWPSSEEVGERIAAGEKGNPWPRMLGELLRAAGMTVFLSFASFPLAMFIGLLVALGRVYGPRWLAIPLEMYVEVLRGTPLLLQLYIVFYLVPGVVPALTLSPLAAGIIGLAINYSAYEAENYRAGLLAIPRGQMEAALALGMTPLTAIRVVIVPQAVRLVIPPVTNDFIALFKDTSVCSVILITELTRKYNELYNFNRDYIVELAFVTAGLYLVMSYPLAILARRLERKLGMKR
ncbi:MAG TPA: ABC transporter substrate-binding protein/permease [Urbifossiella sp.]|nr:ABC transporter substrate-binding protein/permease [Urbifossiella sp.]